MEKTTRQPKVLPYLFLTELWERFGFYIVQGLLVLYLAQYFGLSDAESYTITGLFSALVYISPFVGGLLADKWLGFKNAILLGGLFLIAGYAMLAFPFAEQSLFYPALSTIIIGNGLFKPNISSLLGTQYTGNDTRRDAGFTIFYVGINIGVFLAGASSGYIKNWFGWQTSFALASVGLMIGLITFVSGFKHLQLDERDNKCPRHLPLFFLGALLAIAALSMCFHIPEVTSWILPAAGIVLLLFLVVLILQQEPDDRQRLFMLTVLIVSSIVFWTLFLQIFFSANLFIDRLVDKQLMGIPITTTLFYASESVFIIILGPIFAGTWHALGRNDKNPSPIAKFILGILFAGIGFLLLSISTRFPDTNGLIHPLWIFGAYLLITIGELLISPIGLSAVTLLSPTHLAGMMMGIWFVALGFGGLFAGMLAKMAEVPGTLLSAAEKLTIYHDAFLHYAYFAFIVAACLWVVQVLLKVMMRRL
jgi:proton-dependent oligopeptide transporter, POT family